MGEDLAPNPKPLDRERFEMFVNQNSPAFDFNPGSSCPISDNHNSPAIEFSPDQDDWQSSQ